MATAGNDDDEVEVDEEDEEAEEGGDLDTSLKLFMKKANGQKKKKPGRKAKWCPQALDERGCSKRPHQRTDIIHERRNGKNS